MLIMVLNSQWPLWPDPSIVLVAVRDPVTVLKAFANHLNPTMGKHTMTTWQRLLVTLFGLLAVAVASAEHGSFVKSIPQAMPGKNLFQVSISRIDGEQPSTFSENIPIKPGSHTLVVKVEAALGLTNLTEVAEVPKELAIDVEAGATYLIAAEINPDASLEEQRAGNYWKPVVHQVVK
jgi:hypothetical protein